MLLNDALAFERYDGVGIVYLVTFRDYGYV